VNATSGAALFEFYDLAPLNGSLITNMSTRGVVGTSSNVMIGGFIVGSGRGTNGDGSSEVLIRALDPELTSFGFTEALQDPKMELHDGNEALLLANDNWKDSQQAEFNPPVSRLETIVNQRSSRRRFREIELRSCAATMPLALLS
jgi:hypothetical protein